MNDKIYLGMFDIKTFLSHNNIPYWESGKNIRTGWIGIKCLWCDDSSCHLGINPATMGINCWRCSASGTALKLVMKILRVDFNTARNVISEYSTPTGQTRQRRYIQIPEKKIQPDIDLMKKFKFTREMRLFHREYLESRRYDPDKVFDEYNLHFAGPVGKFARKIIIPITMHKKIVSFLGKTVTDSGMPYKNCPDEDSLMDIKNTLYGIDNCKSSSILVVEGVFDKWRIGKDTVATFGTKFTDAQVELLKDFKRVFVLFDSEPQAQKQARELCARLGIYTEAVQLQLEKGDPDDLPEDDVKHLRKQIFGSEF